MKAKDLMMYSTVRIECFDINDTLISTGTGFFFQFDVAYEHNKSFDGIVTNKHVIEGAEQVQVTICRSVRGQGPIDTDHFIYRIKDLKYSWIPHPDNDIDLGVLLTNELKYASSLKGFYLGMASVTPEHIPIPNQLQDISPFEDILMIGYPNGLWDDINNKPIIRKGITATNLRFDYCGRKEFLIDAACFPGSSGSPVFIYKEYNKFTEPGVAGLDFDIFIIGILYAGPQHRISGEILVVDVPSATRPVAFASIPNNLGYCIKSSRLLELKQIINEMFPNPYKNSHPH